jgi:hypothetical protein
VDRTQVDWNTDGQGMGHRKTGTETQTDRQRAGTQTDRKRYTDRQRGTGTQTDFLFNEQ